MPSYITRPLKHVQLAISLSLHDCMIISSSVLFCESPNTSTVQNFIAPRVAQQSMIRLNSTHWSPTGSQTSQIAWCLADNEVLYVHIKCFFKNWKKEHF